MGLHGYRRIFGSGPAGILLSLLLLGLAVPIKQSTGIPELGMPSIFRLVVLLAGVGLAALLALWSVVSLPVTTRGQSVCDRGAFRYLRHPLYASLVSLFFPALAIYLDHVVYLGWAVALHPVWHLIIGYEEDLMRNQFGTAYDDYAGRTGRFVPRSRSFGSRYK